MDSKQIDRNAYDAWRAWYDLFLAECDLSEIPESERTVTIKRAIVKIADMQRRLDSLVTPARMESPDFVEMVTPILKHFERYAADVRGIISDFQKVRQTEYYKYQRILFCNTRAQNELLTKQIALQEEQIKALEKTVSAYIHSGREIKQDVSQIKNTLLPNMSYEQAREMWERLNHIFTGERHAFLRLFNEEITETAPPIKAPTITHIAVLVWFLEKYELIDTRQPYIILERVAAFSVGGKIVTSRQLQKPSQYPKFPYTKPYCYEIEKVVKAVARM